MFSRKLLSVGFGLALVSEVSCSRPLCEVNPGDERCANTIDDMGNDSSISISPLRIHYKSGGTVAITGIAPGASVSLIQKNISQPIGMAPSTLANMVWSTPISNLQGFSPGAATLNITQAGKTIAKPIRLFANTSFVESNELRYTTSPDDSTINWVGVGSQSVFTLNTYTTLLRGVYVYQYSAPNNALNVMSKPFSSNLPTYAKAAANANAVIELRVSTDGKNNRVFQTCPYGSMSGCSDTPQIMVSTNTTYQDIDIVADPLGKFFAFMTTPTGMTTPKLNVLKIENMLPTSQSVSAQGGNINNDMTIKSLITGDFDGDGKTDLATWHSTPANAIEIFIQQPDGSFKFDGVSSGKLQNAIGTASVLAMAAGDLDADGLADVTITRANKVVLKITNTGDGFVADQNPLILTGTKLTTIDGIALGDIGGSKLDNSIDANDIIIASKLEYGLAVLINTLM